MQNIIGFNLKLGLAAQHRVAVFPIRLLEMNRLLNEGAFDSITGAYSAVTRDEVSLFFAHGQSHIR